MDFLMTFGLSLLHDTLVVALALTIAIPLGVYITYSIMAALKALLERKDSDERK